MIITSDLPSGRSRVTRPREHPALAGRRHSFAAAPEDTAGWDTAAPGGGAGSDASGQGWGAGVASLRCVEDTAALWAVRRRIPSRAGDLTRHNSAQSRVVER